MAKNTPKEKYILMLQVIERSEQEKTFYGKLLFQENIISHSIIATLNTLALYLNIKDTSLKINFDLDIFENKVPTLGGLANILYPYLKSFPSIKEELKDYIELRNNLTHNMFSKYKDISSVDSDSEKIVSLGQNTLNSLEDLRNKIRQVI